MRLQPMLFQKLTRSDEFSQCPSCARILYFKPPQDGAEADQSGGP
jgi:predicted  nucleic acid-binding Zn-ribbon protein